MVLKKIKDFVRNYSLGLNWRLVRTVIIGFSVIILAVIILVIASYFTYKPEEISRPPASPPPSPIEEILKSGKVGEEKVSETLVIKLPPVIFSTSGTIKEIRSDRLIIQGEGNNFSDQIPRELTVISTPTTLTFLAGQKIKYQGLDGLKYLKEGMEILIEGEENIRGKTEFKARTINIL